MPAQKIVGARVSMADEAWPRLVKRESLEGDVLVVKGELDPSGHQVRIKVKYSKGVYRVASVEVIASEDEEVSSSVLGIPVKETAEKVIGTFWSWVDGDASSTEQERRDQFQHRQRRRWVDDDFLLRVAEVYKRAEADGADSVIKVVASELGPAGYSSAQRWVSEARKRGLLPPVRPRGEKS